MAWDDSIQAKYSSVWIGHILPNRLFGGLRQAVAVGHMEQQL